MGAPLMSLSSIAGMPPEAQPPPGPDMQNGNAAGDAAVDAIQGTAVQQPKPGILEATTKVDPSSGEKTHRLTVTDDFFQNIGKLTSIGQQAQAAYGQHVQQQQAQAQAMAQQPPIVQQFQQNLQQTTGLLQQALGVYQQQFAEAQNKQKFLDEHPLLTAIGRISSMAAANYSNPRNRSTGLANAAGAFGMDTFADQKGNINAALQNQLGASEAVGSQLEKGAAIEQQGQARKDALALQVQKLEEKRTTDINGHIDNAMKSAQARSWTPAAADGLAGRLKAAGADGATIAGAVQQANEVFQQAVKSHLADQSFTAKEHAASLAQAMAIAELTQKRALMAQETQENKTQMAVARKASEVPQAVKTSFGQLASAREELDKYKALLDQVNAGPVSGRVLSAEQRFGLSKALEAQAQSVGAVLTPMLVGQEGGGARAIASPQFRALLDAAKPGIKNNPQQNDGNYKGVSGFLDAIEAGRVKGLSKAQIPTVAAALKDPVAAFDSANQNDIQTSLALEKAGMSEDAIRQRLAKLNAPPPLTPAQADAVKKTPPGHYAQVGGFLYDATGKVVGKAQ